MRRILVAALIVIGWVCAEPRVFAATVAVTVGPGLSFTPSSVTIAPGDTVQWNWAAGHPHSSTSDSSSGAEVWDSGVIASGSFSHVFNNVGDWGYYCTLHSFPGGTAMNGVVHVASAAPTLASVSPASGPAGGGTTVTLTGTNFTAPCSVAFGSAASSSIALTGSTAIQATTPAHDAGTVAVSVTCAGGSATLPNAFTFTAPSPGVGVPMFSWTGLLALAAALIGAGVAAFKARGI